MTIEREELILITQLIDDLERSDMVFITLGEESDMHDWEKDLIIQALKAYRPSGQSTEDTAAEGSPVVREKRTSEPIDMARQSVTDEDVSQVLSLFKPNYCSICGQKLDWSEE